MELTDIKNKLMEMKDTLGWTKIGTFRDYDIYCTELTEDGLAFWGYIENGLNRGYGKQIIAWEELTDEEKIKLEKFIELRYPKEYAVTRDKYLISFENVKTKEKLSVNLKDKKFTKTYITGKQRDIKYPHSFFKGMDGRLVAKKIPADDNFRKLVDVIISRKAHRCQNMGTFLVRLFDNIHLETYINADIPFDASISVPYNFFDKDVRDILNKHQIKYDYRVESFFGNNHDLGKSMLAFIKDDPKFGDVFYSICGQMRDVNILVENYKYDVKRLFEYCKERNWKTGRYTWRSNDLLNFLCDYARMAELVFPNGFEKYPKDILDHHDGVSKLYAKEKIKFDEEKFKKFIDPKMEYENKEFCMIYPKSTTDIQDEGRILSHCVGSYVDRVLNGSTTILFLRSKENKDTPLVTVEVYDKRINQARGKYNRSLSYDEKVFLEEYAEKKKLEWKYRGY